MEKSQETLNWTPSFENYEDFIQKTLQSLDGFMLVVSTDGIIVSVAPRITSLLGHLPNDIVGKSFLSLLPDDEKREIFSKMAFTTAVSNSVGKYIDFCCHFKRGDAESRNTSAYEYVKVILTLKDVSSECPALFHSFSTPVCEPSTVNLPLDDAFYLVGTICVLRARTLQGFFHTNGPSPLVPNLEEDGLSEDHRSVQERRCFGMESSEFEMTDIEEPANTTESELSESSDSMDSFNTVSPSPSISASPEMYSRQSFESEPEMGHVTYVHELKHVHKVSVMDDTEESKKDVQKNEEYQEDEEKHEEVQEDDKEAQEYKKDEEDKKDQEDQPLQLSPHITSYLKRQEEEMMKKFQEQLNEKTQILQTEIRKQKSSLETLKEQLQESNDSKPQALPPIVGHVDSPDLLEPAPKKPRSEAMKSPFSDISEATSVSGSCLPCSSQIHEELQQTFDNSSKVPIQEEEKQNQEQQLQQQQQPQEEQQQEQEQQQQLQLLLPEQPQQYNTTRENQVMHVFMPNQPCFSMLRCNDGFMPLPLPRRPPPPPAPLSMLLPIQMVAEQQHSGCHHAESLNTPGCYLGGNFNSSGYYHAENFNGPENGRFRFLSENQPRMNIFSMTHSPGSHAIYSTNLPQTTITQNSQLVTPETPQDYICLWQWPQDSQSQLYQVVQMSNRALTEQATLGQATCTQQVAPTEQVQHSPELETVQTSGNDEPNQLNACVSPQQSHLNP